MEIFQTRRTIRAATAPNTTPHKAAAHSDVDARDVPASVGASARPNRDEAAMTVLVRPNRRRATARSPAIMPAQYPSGSANPNSHSAPPQAVDEFSPMSNGDMRSQPSAGDNRATSSFPSVPAT